MPAQIVIVHNAESFASRAASALRDAGYEVAVFADPMLALDALEAAESVEVLITRVNLPRGKPNGVSLALVTKNRRPGIRVVFTARADAQPHTEGIGEFLAAPISIPDLVVKVRRLLSPRAAALLMKRPAVIRGAIFQEAPIVAIVPSILPFTWRTRMLLDRSRREIARFERINRQVHTGELPRMAFSYPPSSPALTAPSSTATRKRSLAAATECCRAAGKEGAALYERPSSGRHPGEGLANSYHTSRTRALGKQKERPFPGP